MTEKIRITMKKSVPLKRTEMIANLSIEEERQDIQSILSGDITSFPSRLLSHLKRYKLLNEDNELTEYGEKVRNSGLLYEPEYGQYEIWWMEKNHEFCIKPLAIHRIHAGGENKTKFPREWMNNSDNAYNVDTECEVIDADVGRDSDKVLPVHINRLKPELVRKKNEIHSGMLVKIVEYDGKENVTSEIGISADKLSWSGNNQDTTNVIVSECSDKEDADKILMNIFPDNYDNYNHWLNVDDSGDDPRKFRRNIHDLHELGFDTIDVDNIPVHASDRTVAKKWLSSLYHKEWENHFVSEEEIYDKQNEWLNSTVFAGHNFESKTASEILNEVTNDGDNKVKWNIAAMMDLLPENSKYLKPFTIEKGNTYVVSIIRDNMFRGRDIQEVIISDRYIKNMDDIKKIRRIIGDCSNITIFTRNKKLNPGNLKIEPLPDKKSDEFDDHDRYWLIKSEKNWEYWVFTQSLDSLSLYSNYNNSELESKSDIHVTPIPKIPDYLYNKIKQRS